VFQINLEHKMSADATAMLLEIDRYLSMTGPAAVTLSWTPFFVQSGNASWREVLDHNRRLVEGGMRVLPQVAPQPITTAIGFDHLSPLMLELRGWASALHGFFSLDTHGRIDRLRSADFRAALVAAGTRGGAMLNARFDAWTIAVSPSRPDLVGARVSVLGHDEQGVAGLCDLVIDDGLATLIHVPLLNDDFDAVCELVADPTTLIGLGDAGAHVRSLTNYAYPTYVLATLVRDEHRLDLASAVHRMTAQPASVFGMEDRGSVAEGYRADICVIDLEALALRPTEIVNDLPGGFPRLHQGAVGYQAVFVSGVQTVANDTFLGAGPGELIRS
jgi:N-acyl-D-aspartate/D-glutamate deacylase